MNDENTPRGLTHAARSSYYALYREFTGFSLKRHTLNSRTLRGPGCPPRACPAPGAVTLDARPYRGDSADSKASTGMSVLLQLLDSFHCHSLLPPLGRSKATHHHCQSEFCNSSKAVFSPRTPQTSIIIPYPRRQRFPAKDTMRPLALSPDRRPVGSKGTRLQRAISSIRMSSVPWNW